MLSVNLSRIHNMIKNAGESVSQLQNAISAHKLLYSFNILQGTKDEDLEAYKNKINKKKRELLSSMEKMSRLLDYIEYLRGILAGQNARHGIEQLLLREKALRRKLDSLSKARCAIIQDCCNEVEECMPVDYYKTSFTDSCKSYSLEIPMFNDADIEKFARERDSLENSLRSVNDEIASLNQTTTVEVMSFEEFAAQKFGHD